MSAKKTKTVKPAVLTMVVEFGPDNISYTDVIEAAEQIIESATSIGYVKSAKLTNLPSEIDFIFI